jgi:ankyrin repeat protein
MEYPEEVNTKDSYGRTPLQYAIEQHQYEAVELLINYGANMVYYWIVVCRTDFDFASRIFALFEDEDLRKIIIHDDKKLSYGQKQLIDEQLIPFIRMHLESVY